MPSDDDLDQWLDEQITPLPPPDGTFNLIKRRARQRKARKLAITLTTAAAVAAAAVLIPRATFLQVTGPATRGVAAGDTLQPTQSADRQADGSATPAQTATSGSSSSATASALPPVPGNFQPSSVTFIGVHTGWVIGQAGTPGHCATQYCTSIARTDNGGQSWYGVPAPETGAPAGSSGVSQLRFLTADDGWAFGPQLWSTTDGGHTWAQVSTGGMRVIGLETAGSRAFAIFATCAGGGADYTAGCTNFTLESATAGSNSWAPVGASTSGLNDAGQSAGAALALTGTAGYLLSPGGRLISGPVSGGAGWTRQPQFSSSSACGSLGGAMLDGQPSGVLLATGTASDLALVCSGGTGTAVLRSGSGGAGWTRAAVTGSPRGTPASLSETADGTLVLATSAGISVLAPGATSWTTAALGGSAPSGGFSYVGMTTPAQGVALPADTGLHEVWMTFNGGTTWNAYPVG